MSSENHQGDRLEKVLLPRFLSSQRWFAGKARDVRRVSIADSATVPHARSPVLLGLVDVEYSDGPPERYFVPLTLTGDPGDVLGSVEASRVLIRALVDGAPLPTRSGGFLRFSPTRAWTNSEGLDPESLKVGVLSEEQSNSALVLDDRVVFKFFRRLEKGPNPEAEIGGYLSSRPDFRRSPTVLGVLEYEHGESGSVTLGVLEEYLDGCETAWTFTLGELERFRNHRRTAPDPPDPAAVSGDEWLALVRNAIGGYLRFVADLGRATAEMHLALADSADAALRPEEIRESDLIEWADSLEAQATRNLRLLESSLRRLPPAAVHDARRVLAGKPAIATTCRELRNLRTGATRKIRCHGDYHLGQVLRRTSDGSVFIIDFEGEPERPIEVRRKKMPAFKDVAGMLRSFSYAACSGKLSPGVARDPERIGPEQWIEAWESEVTTEFVKSYRETANKGSFLPEDEREFDRWIGILLVEKAIYEIGYELNNRPEWIQVPLSGLVDRLGVR